MPLFYTLAYMLGFKPWEWAALQEHERISRMFDREQEERRPPYGSALDLGCGTGMQAVDLAQRGWRVTGIDIVPGAVRAARERARAAGVDVQFIDGDVTALHAAGVGTGFDFLLDFGLFHGLDQPQQVVMAREASAVASPKATMLMIAWAPGRRPPFLPQGVDRAAIEAAFAEWTVVAVDAIPASALPRMLKNADPCFYRLRKS